MVFLAACQNSSSAEPVEGFLTGTRFPVVVLVMGCLLPELSDKYFCDSCVHFDTKQLPSCKCWGAMLTYCHQTGKKIGCNVILDGKQKGFFVCYSKCLLCAEWHEKKPCFLRYSVKILELLLFWWESGIAICNVSDRCFALGRELSRMTVVLYVAIIKFSSLQTLLDVNVEGIIPNFPPVPLIPVHSVCFGLFV